MSPSALAPAVRADPVGEALHRLRVTGLFYCHTQAAGSWAVDMPAFADCASFHVVIEGECLVEVEGHPPLTLRAGDLALVPHGRGHVLASGPGVPSLGRVDELPQEYVTENYSVLRHEGDGPPVELVCGVMSMDGPAARPLLELLPAVLHVPRAKGGPWVTDAMRLIAAEVSSTRPGGEAVTTRLADILVIQAVRAWLDSQESPTGWLGALRDPLVGSAVAAVHRDPARPWTVESLAREATMSRSAFSARFTEVVGTTPMRYVQAWRMHVAADRLARGEGVGRVAIASGYESEAAFSRAFKRVTGRPPSRSRRPVERARP